MLLSSNDWLRADRSTLASSTHSSTHSHQKRPRLFTAHGSNNYAPPTEMLCISQLHGDYQQYL